MFEDTTEDGMTPSGKFTYIGHQVEIVPPDTARLIGNYYQIKIDGVLRAIICLAQRERRRTSAKS
jgi:hypothetical protein